MVVGEKGDLGGHNSSEVMNHYLNVKKISDIERDRTTVYGRVIISRSIEADIRSDRESDRFILQGKHFNQRRN